MPTTRKKTGKSRRKSRKSYSSPNSSLRALPSLTIRQQKFIDAYLNEACGNGTKAAILAGYSQNRESARQIAQNCLNNPNVQKALKDAIEVNGLSATMTINRLTQTIQANVYDLYKIKPNGEIVTDPNGNPVHDLNRARKNGILHLVEKVTPTPFGPKIELASRNEAISLLAKVHGLLIDRQEINVKTDDSQAKIEILAKLRDAVAKLSEADKDRLATLQRGGQIALPVASGASGSPIGPGGERGGAATQRAGPGEGQEIEV